MKGFHGNHMGIISLFCSNLLSNAIFPANLLPLLCGVLSVGGAVPHHRAFSMLQFSAQNDKGVSQIEIQCSL